MKSDPMIISLVIGVCLLAMVVRFLLVVDRWREKAVRAGIQRKEQAPKNMPERATALDGIITNRLGLDPAGIPLDADWVRDLRIPRGELLDFFQDISQVFSIDDSSALERTASYRQVLEYLAIPVPAER